MFKVNNNDTRRRHWRRCGILIVNSSVSMVNFEHVIAGWEVG